MARESAFLQKLMPPLEAAILNIEKFLFLQRHTIKKCKEEGSKHTKAKNGKGGPEKILFANQCKIVVIKIILKRKNKILLVTNNCA